MKRIGPVDEPRRPLPALRYQPLGMVDQQSGILGREQEGEAAPFTQLWMRIANHLSSNCHHWRIAAEVRGVVRSVLTSTRLLTYACGKHRWPSLFVDTG
jgi:hypothetical protein